MNNKGFTMVELLVSMAIMGLLIIMAFPTIRAIQSNNTSTKFKEYGKAVLSAAKLYTDSYEEDLFDLNDNNNMTSIDLNDLVKKDLLKDINISDSTCLNGSSVNIIKYKDDYTYCLNLICSTGGKEVYTELSKEGKCKDLTLYKVTYSYGSTKHDVSVIQGNNHSVLSPGSAHISIPTGYRFVQWNSSSSVGNKKPGEVIEVNSDIEFTPELVPFNYKIRYKSSLDGTVIMEGQTCTVGQSCKLKANTYHKDYFSFDGYKYNNKDYSVDSEMKNVFSITEDNQIVDVTAKIRKNTLTIFQYSNGGKLTPGTNQLCRKQAGCGKNQCLGNNEINNPNEVAKCKNSTGLIYVGTPSGYDNTALNVSGLRDYASKNGTLYMTRSGCTATGYWHVDSPTSTTKINETQKYANNKAFVQACGAVYDNDYKTKDITINLYAGWNCPNSITCVAGTYLPKNTSKCATCLSKYYCVGGIFKKSTTKNQGLTSCPNGYKNSPAGSKKITQCYMNVAKNYYVKTPKASSAIACDKGQGKLAHKVNYGNTSACENLPTCTIKASRNPNKLGWYKKNVTLTLNTTGDLTKKGLATTKKSTNGKTTASVTNEGTTTYYGYVENALGSNTCSITIQLDKTPPTLKDYKYYVHNNVKNNAGADRLNQPSGKWPGSFKVKLRSVTSTDKTSGVYAYYMYFEPTVLVNTTIYRPSGNNIPNKSDTTLPLTSSDCKKVRHYVDEVGAYSTGYFCRTSDLIGKVQEYPIKVPASADHYNFDWCGGIKVYDKAGNMITTSQGDDNNKKVANRSGMGSNSQCIKVNHANNNSTIFTFKKF